MRCVRCDACGKKALLAASQCPHCGHLLDIRDSFGELLPLAHCASCDSDYPLKRGACRWCGTMPERAHFAPHLLWKGAGVTAFVGLALGAWLTHRSLARDLEIVPPLESAKQSGVMRSADSGAVTSTLTLADSVFDAKRDSLTIEVAPDAALASATTVVEVAQPATVVDTTANTPHPVAQPAVSKSTVPRPRKVRWNSAVANRWIPVRATASPAARIVASVGPDTRVQLGEVRGPWIRLRMRGLSGWVERRHFVTRSESAR